MRHQRLTAPLIFASIAVSAPVQAETGEPWFSVMQGRCIAADAPAENRRAGRDDAVMTVVTVDARGQRTSAVYIRGRVRCEDQVKDVQRALAQAADFYR